MWKRKGINIGKIIFKKKNKMRGTSLSDFKTYDIATVINPVVYMWGQIHRSLKQNTKIDLHKYDKSIFDKAAKTIQWRKDSFSNKRGRKKRNKKEEEEEERGGGEGGKEEERGERTQSYVSYLIQKLSKMRSQT